MDAKIKAKWVKALRSGKYKQARGTLCGSDGAVCCIAVGALVADKSFKPIIGATGTAAAVIGLTPQEREKLVKLNDIDRKTFRVIATYIEKNL